MLRLVILSQSTHPPLCCHASGSSRISHGVIMSLSVCQPTCYPPCAIPDTLRAHPFVTKASPSQYGNRPSCVTCGSTLRLWICQELIPALGLQQALLLLRHQTACSSPRNIRKTWNSLEVDTTSIVVAFSSSAMFQSPPMIHRRYKELFAFVRSGWLTQHYLATISETMRCNIWRVTWLHKRV